MPVPINNIVQGWIKAYQAGLQERLQQEQIAEEKKRYEEAQKLKQQQLKDEQDRFKQQMDLSKEQFSVTKAMTEAQFKLRQAEAKREQLEHWAKFGTFPKMDTPNLGSQLPAFDPNDPSAYVNNAQNMISNPVKQLQSYIDPNTGLEFSREEMAGAADWMDPQEARLIAAEAAAAQREADRISREQENEKNRQSREEMNARRIEAALLRASMSGSQGVSPDHMENVMRGLATGEINSATLKDKDNRYSSEAVNRGIYIQSPKWIEESKKLRQSSEFVKLATRILDNPANKWGNVPVLAAEIDMLQQQIGALGEAFPALGKLSDKDLEILRAGTPSAKTKVWQKLFPRYGETMKKYILSNFGARVESHLANVPSKEEAIRLLEMYGIGHPEMRLRDRWSAKKKEGVK